ncbi:plasmid partitioning protein RepB C-terminal domain-containing protein [Stenotrophomonas sp. SY1]|uniref:plasmid partitioning protein RepB C-terminal domain-containing protein n=1 Tax=Stenotrophomonas sp. SY1 TaxID=477235 RepID=UPI001E408C7E|nr:plasmid partitioning protein RepB C-terminal domain-containing protein [Stenotrophomonas sp. SY1]MCD9085822.1 ParB N-terminal domain-containing protein [Stenotrophomonas sp. SY1]
MNNGHQDAPLGFRLDTKLIPICSIVPLKPLRKATRQSQKFQQITASIRTIGLVELPVVAPNPLDDGTYLLLDGLMRVEILRDLGAEDVECLISTDDESYTYNKRISRLSAVQEHMMIVRAVEHGVSEDRIAEALNLEATSIRRRFRLLDGICPEVATLLSDKTCPMVVFEILKRMKPLRQIEAAELMSGHRTFTTQFARALLHATPDDQLVKPMVTGRKPDITREQISKLERELSLVQSRTMFAEETYGIDNLHLTIARGFLNKILSRPNIVRWLNIQQPEYLAEFQRIGDIDRIDFDPATVTGKTHESAPAPDRR